jgi:hypothetical protein
MAIMPQGRLFGWEEIERLGERSILNAAVPPRSTVSSASGGLHCRCTTH